MKEKGTWKVTQSYWLAFIRHMRWHWYERVTPEINIKEEKEYAT